METTESTTIGQLIKKARLKRGYSYHDMLFKLYNNGLRVALNTLVNWESGRTEPKPSQLIAIAKTLGISVSYFFAKKNNLSGQV